MIHLLRLVAFSLCLSLFAASCAGQTPAPDPTLSLITDPSGLAPGVRNGLSAASPDSIDDALARVESNGATKL
jgi:hypothetical protein